MREGPDGELVSVPCTEHYNHHYSAYMQGKAATQLDVEEARRLSPDAVGADGYLPNDPHGTPLPQWRIAQKAAQAAPAGIPHVQAFSEGNGNEHRVSLHAYPKGFAQLIHSPTVWNANAMIINTNKAITDDTSPGPIGGPQPKMSLAPKDADYQGILECPCGTRVQKVFKGYKASPTANCPISVAVDTPAECEAAAAAAGLAPAVLAVVSDAATPPGCSAAASLDGWRLSFNNASATTAGQCGTERTNIAGSTKARAIGISALGMTGSEVGVTLGLDIDAAKNLATIKLEGNASVWFAVGLDAKTMADQPYALVVDGTGKVTERRLGNRQPGTLLPPAVQIVSNRVSNGRRTVVLTRPLKGATAEHYSFSATADSIDFISAEGSGPVFACKCSRSLCVFFRRSSKKAAAQTIRHGPAA